MDAKLERRLQENYDALRDPSIFYDIGRLERMFPDPRALQNKPVITLKRLTKVASHFIPDNGNKPPKELSDQLLAWTFDVGEIAIQKIERGKYDPEAPKYSQENVERMRAHLYGHNASILVECARRSTDADEKSYLLKLSYEKTKRSILIAGDIDIEYIGYKQGRCGDIARKIAELEPDPKKKSEWLKSAYDDIGECSAIIEQFDSTHTAHQYLHRATVAQQISEIEDRDIWTQRARDNCNKGMKRARALGDKHTAYALSYAHRILENIADGETDKSQKEQLLDEAYEYGNEAVKRGRRDNPRHAAITAANIGRTAEKLFRLTREEAFRDRAISDYATCRNFFEKYPDEEIYGFLRKVGDRIQELLGLKNEGKNYIRKKRKKSRSRRIINPKDRF